MAQFEDCENSIDKKLEQARAHIYVPEVINAADAKTSTA